MNYLLETENLTKKYAGKNVVENVSLHIPENRIYGLLGPNGAGKSTILKMICGINRPSQGEIFFEGRPWERTCLNEIGALIENPPLYTNLDAYENLEVRASLLKLKNVDYDELLQKVGLKNVGKKKTGQFSLGMKQRLGIALAIMNKPKLLILDEPLNGLDPIGIEEFRETIRNFAKEGMTVILSSHILSEVAAVADNICIVTEGNVRYEGEMPKERNIEEFFMDVVRGEEKIA